MLSQLLKRRPRGTQAYLLGLVAAVVVPLLFFAAFLLHRFAEAERARYEREAARIARQVGIILDGKLAEHIALLQGLAASSALTEGDLERFYAEAKRAVGGRDDIVLLRDLERRQFLNTQLPFGSALPPAVAISPEDQRALAAGRRMVWDVYASPISGEARIAIAIPIVREHSPTTVLAITVPTSRFRDALAPAVPPGWIIGVGDRNGNYVTRSARHDEVTGKPGDPAYLGKAVGNSGTFISRSLDGSAILAGYYRSDFSGWLYGANIPQAVVEAPLRRSVADLATVGVLAFALSVLLAYRFGREFTTATGELEQRAIALGRGQPLPPVSARLTEFQVVADAMTAAAAAIEERTRELETVLSTVPAAVWFTYDPEGRRVIRNRVATRLMRIQAEDAETLGISRTALGEIQLVRAGEPVPDSAGPLQRALKGESVNDEEYTFAFPDGTSLTLLTSAAPLRNDQGAIIGAVLVGLDISERKRSETQRRLLVHELNHRVKNTLATVQSIAVQTLRGTGSADEAREAITSRLMALAKAHDALTRESWEGAELHAIVSAATAPHGGRDRFRIGGPRVWLTPNLTLAIALGLHELATNAAKYGSLSTAEGSVSISWEVLDEPGGPVLTLRWAERGGGPVRRPTRRGFGTRLIERTFSAEIGGEATIDFRPEGVVCTIRAALRDAADPVAAAS